MQQEQPERSRPPVRERPAYTPIFNFPVLIAISIGLLVAVYGVQSLVLPASDEEWLLETFAFSPLRYVLPLGGQDLAWVWTPVTYSLLHGSWQHLLFNALWMSIFGTPVVRRIGTMRYLLFWIASAAVSAGFYALLHWGEPALLIGASGAISALMGAACRFAFPAGGSAYDPQRGHLYPRQPIGSVFRNRTVAVYILVWLFGNVVVGLGLPIFGEVDGAVAWEAHVGGFAFGFLLFGLFDRQPSQR